MVNVSLGRDSGVDMDPSSVESKSVPKKSSNSGLFLGVYRFFNDLSRMIWRKMVSIVLNLVSMLKSIFITRDQKNEGNHVISYKEDGGLWYRCMKASTSGRKDNINRVTLMADVWLKITYESKRIIDTPLKIQGIPENGLKNIFDRMNSLVQDIFTLYHAKAAIIYLFSKELLWLMPQPFASFITNITASHISNDAIVEQYELLDYITDSLYMVLNTQKESEQNFYMGVFHLLLVHNCVIEGNPDCRSMVACINCWLTVCNTSLKDVAVYYSKCKLAYKLVAEYMVCINNLAGIHKYNYSDFIINEVLNNQYIGEYGYNRNNIGTRLLFSILRHHRFIIPRSEQLNNVEGHTNPNQEHDKLLNVLRDSDELVSIISAINAGFDSNIRNTEMEVQFKSFCYKYLTEYPPIPEAITYTPDKTTTKQDGI